MLVDWEKCWLTVRHQGRERNLKTVRVAKVACAGLLRDGDGGMWEVLGGRQERGV